MDGRSTLWSVVFCFLAGTTAFSQETKQQKPGHRGPPGVVIDRSPDPARIYIGSPSIAVLPDGRYVASHDWFGPGTKNRRTTVLCSQDRGRTWQRLTDLDEQWWSSLFVHRGALYIMGTSGQWGDAVIRRSTNGGRAPTEGWSWTTPRDADTGLLAGGGQYHCAPVPVVVHNGRIWRAMEDRDPPEGWGRTFRSFVMSAPEDADLLKADNWTFSNRMHLDPKWLEAQNPGWLEGNVVVTPQRKLVNILRVNDDRGDRAAIVRVSDDGRTVSFDPERDFIDLPGGRTKFTIRYDPASKRYWSLVNKQRNPTAYRNVLVLTSSADLRSWKVESTILRHADSKNHAFQYVDWLFEDNDIIAVSRTAWDGSHRAHDANYMTFHRIPNFRELGQTGDKSHVNSVGMKLVRIEPGSFTMGSPEGGDFDERPAHKVAISRAFFMGTTEVTNAQYEQFDPQHKRVRGKLGFSKEDDEAAVFVSWHDAVRFCRWLSKKEGKPYRLPTEAEWEYACRAGTTTPYHTGKELPKEFHKNARVSWYPSNRSKEGEVVPLLVGRTPANPWGLHDMHGNVEEWCHDWYGPHVEGDQKDPVGRAEGDFRVTHGGSHSTTLPYLRSANRLGTVLGEMPGTKPLPVPPLPLNRRNVKQEIPANLAKGPDPTKPYFKGPRTYVKIPANSEGPMFSRHNHDPALVECPNGDLLAIWYSCRSEAGRELCIVASRLRYGQEEWEPASPFWDAPDRNDHAPAMWADGHGTIYHFNGLSAAATWGNPAIIMRVSTDSGATWSKARLVMSEHGMHHQPVESVFQTREGWIILPCDAVPGGSGGTAVIIGRDGGKSWFDPGEGKPRPDFREGATGAWIAGIHAGVTQLKDGRLLAFGRGDSIDGRMPRSISSDLGQTWTYSPSPFPPIGGGQRLILMRLKEGPIFFASFAKKIMITDASGQQRPVSGLFAALSTDEGETWQIKRLVSDDGPPREVDGGGNTGKFTMSHESAEPRGYMSACQTPDGVIHLISSKQHYAFNLAWLSTPAPAAPSSSPDSAGQGARP